MSGAALGLITARGGSKGVPGKNVRPLGGRPLIQWTVDSATRSQSIGRLVLSTDDDAIADAARAAGCDVPFMRPAELATDETGSAAVIRHALETLNPTQEIVVLLQPTSPFRSAADIDGCVERLIEAGAPLCVSVVRADPPPEHVYRVTETGRMIPVLSNASAARRQDLAPAFALNGAIYAFRRDWFMDTGELDYAEAVAHEMPAERSLDIDTMLDFEIAETIAKGYAA